MLMQNDRKFRDCSALYVTCSKTLMTTTHFWPQIRFFASHSLKEDLTQLGKTFVNSHYKWNIWSLTCENHSITCSSISGYLGVKRPIFARFADIMLTRKNSRRVTSPASRHGFAKSIISSDSWVVFYSFSFRDNFYLESHSTRRAACFWHDENNSDQRDTRLKRLSGYRNWEYCCVSAVA